MGLLCGFVRLVRSGHVVHLDNAETLVGLVWEGIPIMVEIDIVDVCLVFEHGVFVYAVLTSVSAGG